MFTKVLKIVFLLVLLAILWLVLPAPVQAALQYGVGEARWWFCRLLRLKGGDS